MECRTNFTSRRTISFDIVSASSTSQNGVELSAPFEVPVLEWIHAKALVLLGVAQFLVTLDTSIIGVAPRTIQQQFGVSQSGLQWIFSTYVIVFGALLLLGGRLSDFLEQRKIFVNGFAILTAASLLAGLAPGGNVLIAARTLQGIGWSL